MEYFFSWRVHLFMISAMLEVLWECSGSEKCDDSEEYGCGEEDV